MKHLIAIDSDGTLRRSDGTISARTKDVILKLLNDNNVIVICTARPRYHTLKVSKEAGTSDYLISSNGTEIYDNINKKVIYSEYLSSDICMKVYEETKKLNLRVMFVSENTEYVTEFTRNDSQVLLDDSKVMELLNKDIKQIMIIDKDKETVIKYKKELEKEKEICFVDSSRDDKDELWFSMISSKASKGNALKKLAEYLSIPLDNTIAIGNDWNDMSMLGIAGLSVAVSNATDDIKNIADQVTLSNDADGVAVFLETLL